MFERLKRLFDEKRIDGAGLSRAVTLGWITQAQADEIAGVVK
ncbi:MAG: XkdX family protein [Oscillospiraceae bacterium]